jgi:predicted NUDIX family NTP pyrophosphohydrolase
LPRALHTPRKTQISELKPIKQKGGKIVYAWAVEADIDADAIKSNTFEMEWPPRTGKTARFPEVDRAAWFDPETAKQKINPAQAPLITELLTRI